MELSLAQLQFTNSTIRPHYYITSHHTVTISSGVIFHFFPLVKATEKVAMPQFLSVHTFERVCVRVHNTFNLKF